MIPGTYCTNDEGCVLFADNVLMEILHVPDRTFLEGKKIADLKYFRFYPRHEIKLRTQEKGFLKNVPVTLVTHDEEEISVVEYVRITADEDDGSKYYESIIYPEAEFIHINRQDSGDSSPAPVDLTLKTV